jgi:putative ABC transport system ATP-binding protein
MTQASPLRSTSPVSYAVRLIDIVKSYTAGDQPIHAIDHLSLDIPQGQFTAVVGRSGSGKSTLLNLLAGIDTPSSGQVFIGETDLSRLDDDVLTRLRRDEIGMIYQFFNLLSTLTVRENVMLPALLGGRPELEAAPRADMLIEEVGMKQRQDARPHTLSGGEMQRTAIARALMQSPPLILADEPTGNLDSRTADQVLNLLRNMAENHGSTVILVTHSREAAATADRVIELLDGRVVSDELSG